MSPQPSIRSTSAGARISADRAPDEIMATFVRGAAAGRVRRSSRSSPTRFPETGLTCVLILSESHAVLHTGRKPAR